VGAKASNKWIFVGGAPASVFLNPADAALTSTTYTDCATVGPSFTVPVAGDYLTEHGAYASISASSQPMMSLAIGAAAAIDDNSMMLHFASAGVSGGGSRQNRLNGLAAGTALVCKYKSAANAVTWRQRLLSVQPIAVGG